MGEVKMNKQTLSPPHLPKVREFLQYFKLKSFENFSLVLQE